MRTFLLCLLICLATPAHAEELTCEQRTCEPPLRWTDVIDLARNDLFKPGGPTRHPWPYCNVDCCDEPGLDGNDWRYPLAVAEWAVRPWQAFEDLAPLPTHERALALAAIAIQQRRTNERAAEVLAAEALALAISDQNSPSGRDTQPWLPWVTLLNAFSKPAARRLLNFAWWQNTQTLFGPQKVLGAVLARATVDVEPECMDAALARAREHCVGADLALILPRNPEESIPPSLVPPGYPFRDLHDLKRDVPPYLVRSLTFSDRDEARKVLDAVLSDSTSGLDVRPENLMSVMAALDDPPRAILLAQSKWVPEPAPAMLEMYFRARPGVWPEGWVLPEPTDRDLSASLVLFER